MERQGSIMALIDLSPRPTFAGKDIMANFNKLLSTSTDVQNVKFGTLTTTGAATIGGQLTLESTAPKVNLTDTNSFTDANDTFIVRAGISANDGGFQWRDDSTSTLKTLLIATSAGDVSIPNGDLYTVAWTDYSGTSTVTGFTGALSANVLRYKKVGKLVFVSYDIGGTSNSSSFSFTLPITAVNTSNSFGNASAGTIDNGTQTSTPGRMVLPANSSTVIVQKDFSGSNNWTTSGTKRSTGSFWYEAA